MCFSLCPYENRNGECGLSLRNYPTDAHCADEPEPDYEWGCFENDDVDDPHLEEKIGGDR